MKWVIRLAAIIAAVLALHRICVLPWEANRVLLRVDSRSRFALKAEPRRATINARTNLDELKSIAGVQKDEPAYFMLSALNKRILQRNAEAVADYDEALRFDQRPEIYLSRGMTLLEMGRQREALDNLAIAARFDPTLIDAVDASTRELLMQQLKRPRV